MHEYQLHILAPIERPLFRRTIVARDDEEAKRLAREKYESLRHPAVEFDRFVLYDGERVVEEHVEKG